MRLYDFTGFEVITDTAAGDSFLMCTIIGCDAEWNIENNSLLQVMDTAFEHKVRYHE